MWKNQINHLCVKWKYRFMKAKSSYLTYALTYICFSNNTENAVRIILSVPGIAKSCGHCHV